MQDLAVYREPILDHLGRYIHRWSADVSNVNRWGGDLGTLLYRFTGRGKLIRGSLVCMAYSLFKKPLHDDAVMAGSAMELVQSALLIHDDIMDRDGSRRGQPSVHCGYREYARRHKLARPSQYGVSMALCAGDVAFFMAYDLLAGLAHPPGAVKARLIRSFSMEFARVGLAQMADMHFGASSEEPDRATIENHYRFKTARYTFALPLWMGALLAGAPEHDLRLLERIGENMGIMFQIVDDELELLHSSTALGKAAGSDLRQGKKTLHRLALIEACGAEKKEQLRALEGKADISPGQMHEVRRLMKECGVLHDMQQKKEDLFARTLEDIGQLGIASPAQEALRNVMKKLMERSR